MLNSNPFFKITKMIRLEKLAGATLLLAATNSCGPSLHNAARDKIDNGQCLTHQEVAAITTDIQPVNDESYTDFINQPGISVVIFGSMKCQPCDRLIFSLNDLKNKNPGKFALADYSLDACSTNTATQLGITPSKIPIVAVYQNGQLLDQFDNNGNSPARVSQWISR